MTRASSRREAAKESTSEGASLQTESGSQASSSNVSETFPMTNPIRNPPERTPTTQNQRSLSQLCYQFGIREGDAQLPKEGQFADMPPPGFVTVNRHMCSHGAIPPFNTFLGMLLRQLSIAPSQLL